MLEQNNPIPKQGGGRKTLLLLAAIFVLPFTIAATLHLLDVRPSGKSYGELITPPVSLKIPVMQNAQGKSVILQKKWHIVMVERANCDVTCQATTHLLGNVRISLDKDTKRVQQVLLLLGTAQAEAIAALQKNNPDLLILTGDEEANRQFASKLESLAKPQNIYLVDPLGNLMMQYPRAFDPKGLRSDLVRLLKNSWVG